MTTTTWRGDTRVLGLRLFTGDVDGASNSILARIEQHVGGYVCLANVHIVVTSWHEPVLVSALNDAWMICPDGAPIAWVMRQLGAVSARRVAGADLMHRLVAAGQVDGLRHVFFGSTTHVLERLEQRLLSRFPQAEIVGTFAPGRLAVGEPTSSDTIGRIKDLRPDVIWCGLGAPKQELWMRQHADLLAPAILIGVGAAFEFSAGTRQRAPAWMQRCGLEWTHRLASEPRRLARRYIRTNSEFIVRAIAEVVARKWFHDRRHRHGGG